MIRRTKLVDGETIRLADAIAILLWHTPSIEDVV